MRCFFFAIGLVVLIAATSPGQLLSDPNAKPDATAEDKPVPGRPAVGAKGDAEVKRAGDAGRAAPQTNAMFAAMDADSDGVISKVELRKAIKSLKTLDTDNDGSITLAEASVGGAAVGPGGPLGEDPQIAQLMANDKNKDGKLTPNEVPNEMLPMLQGVDQNGDRAIDRAELQAAWANRNQAGGGPWRGQGGLGAAAGNAEQATGQFLRYDRNRDGRLTNDEVPPQAARMLQGADRNNDAAIDAGELQAALAQQGGKARALRGGVDPDDARGRKNLARDRKPGGDEN
jgi:Ca2+-binding EF-hand superfamily protein